MVSSDSIPSAVIARFDVFDWRNALAICSGVHSQEWNEVLSVLADFELRWTAIAMKGKGNKSEMAAILDGGLYRCGWVEKRFNTSVVVDGVARDTPTHEVDCFKGKVALEVEWNNKDPFFDRDLNNFRLLYELGVIDLGIIVTRSTSLQQWLHANHKHFGKQPSTYGGSTTHADKLYPRIRGGGAGGCPVAVFAIKTEAYVDDRPVA
jgi:hypothetical protein